MFASRLSPWLLARGVHYAWIIAGFTFLCGLCSSAAMSIPGVLIVAISKDLGWSVSDIAYAAALRLVLFGAIAPFAGALLTRYGVVRMMVISIILIVIGLVLSTAMTAKWQLWLGMGFLLGIAPGMTALVVSVTVASRWFTARRGLVVGILGAAVATGQLLFLPVAARIADAYGWRVALLPAIAAVALCGLLYALFGRDDPSELGLPRYGEDAPAQPPAKPSGSAVALSLRSLSLAGRQPVFWILFSSFFICGLSTIGLMATHFVPFCADAGVATVTAAGMLAVMGICDFFGTIGSGWLSDRFDSRWLLTWYYTLRGFSLVWLAYSDFSLFGLSVFAVFFGLDYIATIPPTVRLTVQAFGRDRGPVVFGWIFAGHQLGAATMAAAAGASRDALATYLPAFVSGGLASVAAGALMLLLIGARNPTRSQPA
ncbi:MAG: MFS transporter [Xanthobacteraceae bacterium]|nr:MFS transporter [Xanthobacteraceae bacterium]